jgi:hypothetical protein
LGLDRRLESATQGPARWDRPEAAANPRDPLLDSHCRRRDQTLHGVDPARSSRHGLASSCSRPIAWRSMSVAGARYREGRRAPTLILAVAGNGSREAR